MDPARWSRAARRRLGMSQRDFATRTGVSRAHINALESGRRTPNAALLDHLLAAAGLDLMLCTRLAPGTPHELEAHLRLSLTQRLRLALGEHPNPRVEGTSPEWRELLALAGAAQVALERPLAVRLWLPSGPAHPVRVQVHKALLPLPELQAVEATFAREPMPAAMVPVTLRRGRRVWVSPPAELALDAEAELLRLADHVLHERAARDDAGRRRPAHRDPDEWDEAHRLERTKGSERIVLPDSTDGRGWRLDAPASLAQWLGPDGRLLR